LIGNNFDPTFIETRRKGLHEYIHAVLSHSQMKLSPAVKEFIFMDTQGKTEEEGDGEDGPRNPNEKHKVTLDDFYLLKVIGKGSFGKVMLAKHKQNGKVFAVKVISKKAVKQRDEVKHIMAGEGFLVFIFFALSLRPQVWRLTLPLSIIPTERNVLMNNAKHPFLVGLRYSFQTAVLFSLSFLCSLTTGLPL